jgi:hypothetical protein
VAHTAEQEEVCIPTLTMMEGTAAAQGVPHAYQTAHRNLAALHTAGVPVLAGTDANTQPGVPFQVAHGESIHHKLELLVDGDPLTDIRATHALHRIWCAGTEQTPATESA